MKDPQDSFVVKLIYIDNTLQYTEQEMTNTFVVAQVNNVEIQPYTWTYTPENNGIRGELSKWDNEKMLKELSGRNIVGWDRITFKKNTSGTKQIVVNGKSSSAWIDAKGMIGSHSEGGPTWIQWVLWDKTISKKQLLQYVKDNFLQKIPPEYIKQLDTASYLTDKGKLIPVTFAQYLQESEDIEGINGNLFKYISDEGLWRDLNDNEVWQIIIREVKDILELDTSKPDLEAMLKFVKVHAENKIIKHRMQEITQHDLCLHDCILDTRSWTVRPYTKHDYKLSKLPYSSTDITNYEQCKPERWLQFLDEIFASYEDIDGIRNFWQEVIGHFLLPITKWGKMFILHGGGWNGKGQFLWAIKNMLGDGNSCTIELNKLEDVDRAKLLWKFLAIDSDTSDNVRLDIGPLRKIIDGEPIEGRRRHWHPFDFRPFARIVVASNVAPTISKMDTNMSRRIVYVPFRENFQHRADTELSGKLEKEALGIFVWALYGLKRLLQRWNFDIPKEILYETEQYLGKFRSVSNQDSVDRFMQYLGLKPWDMLLPKSRIYAAFEAYCKQEWIRKYLGKQQLTRVLWNKWFNDKDMTKHRGMWVDISSLNMTFFDNLCAGKSYEDSS